MQKWQWELPPRFGFQTSGALEDLFRAEARKAPGHLSKEPPSDSATLLAREAIQNSWDAAIEQASDASDRQMTLEFKFDRLSGAGARQVIDTLGLAELKSRSVGAGGWKEIQVQNADVFVFIKPDKPLGVLTITETGTTGMYGPWDLRAVKMSKMILALLSGGMNEKVADRSQGGTYGYGKAGLLTASATRTVIAYSCFKDDEEHPSGATRRLYGMTYWKNHVLEDRRYLGFGHFGVHNVDLEDPETFPFEDSEADRVAQELGLEIRDPDNLGTTFLLIEPVITPEDLKLAVERNWWPALIQYDDLIIDIVDQDGIDHSPAPKTDPDLKPYIRAFEIATQADSATLVADREKFSRPQEVKLVSRGKRPTQLGRLGLVADPAGWSFPKEDPETEHKSLVAMVRGPRMVTEYYECGPGNVRQIRGVFIADDLVDGLLQSTEPPPHDHWSEEKGMGGVEDEAPDIAKKIHSHTKQRVKAFRSELKPAPPASGEYHFPELAKILNELFIGRGGNRPPPKPAPRLVHVEPKGQQQGHTSPGGMVHMTAGCAFSLTDTAHEDQFKSLLTGGRLHARITASFQFDEDGRVGTSKDSHCKLNLTNKIPKSFTVGTDDKGSLIIDGPIGDDDLPIEIKSDPYDRDYTGRIAFTVGPVPGSGDSDG